MSEWNLVEAEVNSPGRNGAPSKFHCLVIAYLLLRSLVERDFGKRNESNTGYNNKWDNQNQNQGNRTEQNRGRGNGNSFRSQGQGNVNRNKNNGVYAVYQM